MDNLTLIQYVVDDEHMNGTIITATEDRKAYELTGRVPCVLYFDPELCSWMIDEVPNLRWNKTTEEWETDEDS